jgi:hypothetical protein
MSGKLNIQLPELGMNYYINNIFASDFIHDFRYGGAGTERLNSLANKVNEILEIIGYQRITTPTGGDSPSPDSSMFEQRAIDLRTEDKYESANKKGRAIPKSTLYKPGPEPGSYASPINQEGNETSPETEENQSKSSNQNESDELEAGQQVNVTGEELQNLLKKEQQKWEERMNELISKISVPVDTDLNILIEDNVDDETRVINYLKYNVLYKQSPWLPLKLTFNNGKEEDENIPNDLIQYGNYELSEREINEAQEVLKYKREELIQNKTDLREEAKKLAKLHQMLAFELSEYTSELTLSITAYIGSKMIEIDNENSIDLSNPIHREVLLGLNNEQIDIENEEEEEGEEEEGEEEEGEEEYKDDFEEEEESNMNGGIKQNIYYKGGRPEDEDEDEGDEEGEEEGKTSDDDEKSLIDEESINPFYNSIIKSFFVLQSDIEYNYSKIIEKERNSNALIDIDSYKNLELNLLNKIKNTYIESYLTRNLIGNINIKELDAITHDKIPRYWMPKSSDIIDPSVDRLNLYFKIRAEILDIMDRNLIIRYFTFEPSETRSGTRYNEVSEIIQYYKPQQLIFQELNSIIFPEYTYVHNIRIGGLEIQHEPRNINNLQTIISTNYPLLRDTIIELFEQRENGDYTNVIQNIIMDGEWKAINEIDSGKFAIELFHSSYLKDDIQNTILEILGLTNAYNSTGGTKKNIMEGGQGGVNLKPDTDGISGCQNACSISNQIKDEALKFTNISLANIIDGGEAIINNIEELNNNFFETLFVNDDGNFEKYKNQTINKVKSLFTSVCQKMKDPRARDNTKIITLKTFTTEIPKIYDIIIKKHCSSILSEIKKRDIETEKNKKIQVTIERRESEGKINKEWANQLTEYAAKAALIMTETISLNSDNINYDLNYDTFETIMEKYIDSETELILDNVKLKGNMFFCLSNIYILLQEANCLMKNGDNDENIKRLLAMIGDFAYKFKGDIDERTISACEFGLNKLFEKHQIPSNYNFKQWKEGDKKIINNAVTKYPPGLSLNNSFCPMSSINDAQSTCSNYTKALSDKELEVANMNIQFQDELLNTYYNLQYIIGSEESPPKYEECTILVSAFIGNGMNDILPAGINQSPSILYISKNTNMNINSKDDNKTLGACNVLRSVIESIRNMWSSYFDLMKSGGSIPTPEIISENCWKSMLTKYNYFNFLKCSHLKALGDSTQELNGALKYGGYTSAGKRTYKNRKIYYINDTNTSENIPYGESDGDDGDISPFNAIGDGYRATLSNDRQAGSRSVWLLTCLPDEVVNQDAIGGYSGPEANEGIYVLASTRQISSSDIDTSAKGKQRANIKDTSFVDEGKGKRITISKQRQEEDRAENVSKKRGRPPSNPETVKSARKRGRPPKNPAMKGGSHVKKTKKNGKKTRKIKKKGYNNIFLF